MKFTEEFLRSRGWEQIAGQWVRIGVSKHGVETLPESIAPPSPPKPPRRIRQSTKPLMNKLESEWFEALKKIYAIVIPQSMRFMLGNGIWYKPDFIVWPLGNDSSVMTAFEVKGDHAFRGGFENLKVAANRYQNIKWVLAWKQGEVWGQQHILP